MNALQRLAGGIAVVLGALASPALALDQMPLGGKPPPGGVTSAWPLGIIVLLVALVMLAGTLVARRQRRSHGGRT